MGKSARASAALRGLESRALRFVPRRGTFKNKSRTRGDRGGGLESGALHENLALAGLGLGVHHGGFLVVGRRLDQLMPTLFAGVTTGLTTTLPTGPKED